MRFLFSALALQILLGCGSSNAGSTTGTTSGTTAGTTAGTTGLADSALVVLGSQATTDASGAVSISWALANKAEKYEVRRALVVGSDITPPWTTVGSSAVGTYIDTTATPGTLYAYVVAAIIGTTDAGYSLPVLARPTKVRKVSGLGFYPTSIAFGNGYFVATGAGSKVARSSDGINFTEFDAGVSLSTGVWFLNDKFVSAGGFAGRFRMSTDGQTWTTQEIPGAGQNLTGAAFGAGVYVLVANSGQGEFWTGSSLTSLTAESVSDFTTVAFVNSAFYAGGYGGVLARSSNGTAWVSPTIRSPESLIVGITPGPVVWTRDGLRFAESTPGYWSRAAGSLADLNAQVVAVGDVVYAAAAHGLWKIPNGQSGELLADPYGVDASSLAVGAGRLVAVSNGELLSLAL